MNQLKDLDELAISMDVSMRIALYTLGETEIKQLFGSLKTGLDQGYDPDKVAPLFEQYRAVAAITSSKVHN